MTAENGKARSDGFASRISGSEMSEPLIFGMHANGYDRKSNGSIASARTPRVCAGRMRSGAAMIDLRGDALGKLAREAQRQEAAHGETDRPQIGRSPTRRRRSSIARSADASQSDHWVAARSRSVAPWPASSGTSTE